MEDFQQRLYLFICVVCARLLLCRLLICVLWTGYSFTGRDRRWARTSGWWWRTRRSRTLWWCGSLCGDWRVCDVRSIAGAHMLVAVIAHVNNRIIWWKEREHIIIMHSFLMKRRKNHVRSIELLTANVLFHCFFTEHIAFLSNYSLWNQFLRMDCWWCVKQRHSFYRLKTVSNKMKKTMSIQSIEDKIYTFLFLVRRIMHYLLSVWHKVWSVVRRVAWSTSRRHALFLYCFQLTIEHTRDVMCDSTGSWENRWNMVRFQRHVLLLWRRGDRL